MTTFDNEFVDRNLRLDQNTLQKYIAILYDQRPLHIFPSEKNHIQLKNIFRIIYTLVNVV